MDDKVAFPTTHNGGWECPLSLPIDFSSRGSKNTSGRGRYEESEYKDAGAGELKRVPAPGLFPAERVTQPKITFGIAIERGILPPSFGQRGESR
jgi:hypothetical protein